MVCQYSQWALWCWSMEKYKELGIIFLVLLALRRVRELVSCFGMIYSVEIKLWRRLQEFFFFFLRNGALLKQNDVQKVKNPRGYTGSVLKSLQGSKPWCMGGFRTVLLFEFTWCLINVIFVAELLVYLLYTSYVICTFKWIFTYRMGGKNNCFNKYL